MLKVGVCGATGKMGREVITVINAYRDKYQLSGTYSSQNQKKDLLLLCQNSQVIIDFSVPEILHDLLNYSLKHNVALVIGTTGLTKQQKLAIKNASQKIAILYSANMSLTVNLMTLIAAKSAKILAHHDISILEIHHRNKKDSPSGTAIMLRDNIIKAKLSMYGNDHDKCDDNLAKVSCASIRIGEIYGNHEIMFANQDEVFSVKHQAMNRTLFAKGALTAAEWLINNKLKQEGLYSYHDLLKDSLNEVI